MKNFLNAFNFYNSFSLVLKSIIIGLLAASFFFINNAIAAPPASPYAPNETLSPNCAPGDTNCIVNEALFGPWISNSTSIFTTSSNVGVNSTSPNYDLTLQGSADMTHNLSNGDTAFIELKDQLSSPAPPGVGGVGLFNYPDANPGDRNFVVAGNASSVGSATNTALLGFENTNTNEETKFQALGRLGLRMAFSDDANTARLRTGMDPAQGWVMSHPTSSSGNNMLAIRSAGSAQAVFKDKGEFILTSDSSNTGEPLITFEDSNANPKLDLDNNGNLTINDAFTFPTADGSSSQTLKTDGNGNITWSDDIDTTATPKLYKVNKSSSINPTVSGDNAVVIGGSEGLGQNEANNNDTVIIGGSGGNTASGYGAFIAAGRSSDNDAVSGFIGGGSGHTITSNADFSGILGGQQNEIQDEYGFIGGGESHFIVNGAQDSAIIGGLSNNTYGDESAIVGGRTHQAFGKGSFIGGGKSLKAESYSEVALGLNNTPYTPNNRTDFNSNDRLLVVGNGDGNSPDFNSDAFTILKNGQVGVGIDNFQSSTTGQLFQVSGTARLGDTEIFNSGGSNTATLKIGNDSENIPGCIEIADSDGSGSTFIRANDGALTANTNDCSQ